MSRKPRTIRVEKKEGRRIREYDVYTSFGLDEMLQARLDLVRQAAFNEGFVNLDGGAGLGRVIGELRETIVNESRDEANVLLYSPMEAGIDYLIFNEITGVIYAITVTDDYDAGEQPINFEQTVINAPIGSPIIEQSTQAQKENQLFRERMIEARENIDQLELDLVDLNEEVLPELNIKLDTLEGWIADPSTIPENFEFFEGIVTNEIWAETGVFMEGWFDSVFTNTLMADRIITNHIGSAQVTALKIDVEDLAAFTAFIEKMYSREIVLISDTGSSPFVGGLIRSSNFDTGNISPSNVITGIGSSGWAIDYLGNAVFTDGYFRGEIVVTGGNAAINSEVNVTIRSDTAPTERDNGDDLVVGDIWIDTDDGDRPRTWNGSSWVEMYTRIDGGSIVTGQIESVGYDPGVAGWQVDLEGNAEFNDVTIRGDIIWDGGLITNDFGTELDRGSVSKLGFSLGQIVKWEEYGDDRFTAVIGGFNLGGTIASSRGSLYIGTGFDPSDGTASQGLDNRIQLEAGSVELLNNTELIYKGQTLDNRFSGGGASTWNQLTGKPFETIGARLSVVSDALQADPTNLGFGGSGNSRSITSSTGSNATLTIANTSNAGLMSTTQVSTLNSLDSSSSDWDTAFAQRGSQIAGTGLSWDGSNLNVDEPFDSNGDYSGLRARSTTAGDVGLGTGDDVRFRRLGINTSTGSNWNAIISGNGANQGALFLGGGSDGNLRAEGYIRADGGLILPSSWASV